MFSKEMMDDSLDYILKNQISFLKIFYAIWIE
jgi:hypothetical protein